MFTAASTRKSGENGVTGRLPRPCETEMQHHIHPPSHIVCHPIVQRGRVTLHPSQSPTICPCHPASRESWLKSSITPSWQALTPRDGSLLTWTMSFRLCVNASSSHHDIPTFCSKYMGIVRLIMCDNWHGFGKLKTCDRQSSIVWWKYMTFWHDMLWVHNILQHHATFCNDKGKKMWCSPNHGQNRRLSSQWSGTLVA